MPIENFTDETLRKQTINEEEGSTRTKSKWWRVAILVLVIAAIAGYVVWRIKAASAEHAVSEQKAAAAANRPVPVQVAGVEQRTMPIYFTALGTVTAYNTVTVKSRVDGQLVKVNFREGQQVKKGALLLEIDPAPYAAALAQAEGQYARDQANAVNAQAESARYKSLLDAGVVSQESEQLQESSYGQAQGALKADLAAIEAAKVNLAYTHITSPIDGQVGLRQVDVGNIVHAADTNGLVVVTQLQPISVIFTLPEEQLPEVQRKLMAGEKLTVDAFDRSETTKLASGNLLTVDNQIDTTTGMDRLKAVFTNKDLALFPNQFVNVRLILEDRPNVMVVPASALQTGSSGNFVFVMKKDKTVEARNIVTTITEGSLMLVDKGLKKGEQVVVDGQEKLKAGSKVVPARAGGGGKGAMADNAGASGAAGGKKGKSGSDSSKGTDETDTSGKGKGKSGAGDAAGSEHHHHGAGAGQNP